LSSAANPQHSLGLPKTVLNPNGYTSSRAAASIGSGNQIAVMAKMQQSSKTNLHSKQMHVIVEDKENRRDLVNRQSANHNAPSIPSIVAAA
jgi:hypothetical protein